MKLSATTFGREDGQAIILVVVAMSIFMLGALGLAIDGGQMFAQRQMAQAAADAAAQAGAISILNGATIVPGQCSPIATDARTPCVYARYNGFKTSDDTVKLAVPAPTPPSGVTSSIAVTVIRTLHPGLIRFVWPAATSSITAKATAGLVGIVSPDSIIVLGSGPNALQANNGAAIVLNGGAIAIDSTDPDAATITGGATVTAAAITCACSAGGVQTNNGASTSAVSYNAPVVQDPFALLDVPADPLLTPVSCASSGHPTMYSPSSGTALNPGTYCGGITVSNGVTNVTFNPGIYVIDGGGMTFGGGAITTGNGAMFYLTSDASHPYASVTVGNGVNVTLSAPTTGPYAGVLFFQDRSMPSTSPGPTFGGGAVMSLTGSLYFPTTTVSYSNGSSSAGNVAIVANKVLFTGGTRINYDSTGLKTGLFTKSVALVQ